MRFDFILLIIVFSYLRSSLQTKKLLPHLDRYLYFGLIGSVALLVLQTTVHTGKSITIWLAHAAVLGIIYIALTRNEFKPVKSFIYSIIPVAVLSFFEEILKLVSPSLYDSWEGYFETANVFAIVWFGAMMFIDRRQRKALEKEQLIAVQREKKLELSEAMKAELEVQVADRTAEILGQKKALQQTLDELKSTQSLLIQSEKMASLGELTAGIAHEIQNPLNFVNNFSEVSHELVDEMNVAIAKGDIEEAKVIAADVQQNLEKILQHGKRADAIVKGMLQHSRTSSSTKESTDINSLADEYLRLAYHGLRAKDKSFNVTMKTDFDESIGDINIIPQDIGRVILNLITNAFYAVNERKKLNASGDSTAGYEPAVSVITKKINGKVEIRVADNGNGIPEKIKEKIFQPFFTTKPTGQGTGLGLSLSYDIVKAHGGELKVETVEGKGTEFIIQLPVV